MAYNIDNWADGNFCIKKSKLTLSPSNIPLIDIVQDIRKTHTGPLLLKFPHLIQKQINTLFKSFNQAMAEFDYKGSFNALFPLKTNQFHSFVDTFKEISANYSYGLEAGSKAEILLAMAYGNKNTKLMINGFKDEETIKLAFLASKAKYDVTLVIEGLNELESIVKYSKIYPNDIPFIGIRVKLHNLGIGLWEKSSGVNSKFGLTSSELVRVLQKMKKHNIVDLFKILHFHIGSQVSDITPFKKAIREVGYIYSHLKFMGASNLDSINIGGGLGVEYSQDEENKSINYTIQEFANDVVFLIKDTTSKQGIKDPHIYIESGRFIASSHAVLVAPTLELFSRDYKYKDLNLKKDNLALVDELNYMYSNLSKQNAIEYLHDTLLHMESLLNLFDLGYIDLIDRSNTEILVNLIIKKSVFLLKDISSEELKDVHDMIQERYLLNFSLFQSLPDSWGLGQRFPILPLDGLNDSNIRSASLWDITCDSDGEIGFSSNNPLFLHDVDLEKRDYFVAFFLVGAYQEVLGMNHNLFSKPTQAIIEIKNNSYKIKKIHSSDSISSILNSVGYKENTIREKILSRIDENSHIDVIDFIDYILKSNNYLITHLKISANNE